MEAAERERLAQATAAAEGARRRTGAEDEAEARQRRKMAAALGALSTAVAARDECTERVCKAATAAAIGAERAAQRARDASGLYDLRQPLQLVSPGERTVIESSHPHRPPANAADSVEIDGGALFYLVSFDWRTDAKGSAEPQGQVVLQISARGVPAMGGATGSESSSDSWVKLGAPSEALYDQLVQLRPAPPLRSTPTIAFRAHLARSRVRAPRRPQPWAQS